ncbi:hypothetical protein B0H14DRAFT_3759782 [Mycena olivaceomarginata]|nr:hypothetical protein B0H14DRAFT_3759782 [Mycena olivaceomarginata]
MPSTAPRAHTLWSMLSFSSSSSTAVSPLVRTCHIDQDPDLTDDYLDVCQETYIIEPQSGDIYVLVPPHSRSAPLQRFPYSMSELVDMSPFSFATADDHHVFVGRKATLEVVVELETGAVRFGGPDTCPWGPFPDLDAWDKREPPPRRREVVVGRTDYHVTIHTRPSDKRGLVPVQTLAFSTYGPSSRDKRPPELCGDIRRTPEPYPAPHLRPPPAPSAALRYPPKLAQTTSTDQLPHLESAYVGLVEESGSLFAMSPDRFPLVAFTAGHKRRENAMEPRNHGSGDDRCLNRASSYTDRRCLVGMHPLEGGDGDSPEYRLKRLVDGVPGVVREDHK